MSLQKTDITAKGLKIFIALTFFLSFIPFDLYGQVDVVSGGGTVSDVDTGGVKQTLPRAGNVSVNFKDVNIKTVLHYLSELSGVDIVPSPGVDAMVTMRLRDKPWKVALDIVTRNYGYVYSQDDEAGIIRVIPTEVLQSEEPITSVIPLNYMVHGQDETGQNITQLLIAIDTIIMSESGEQATYLPSTNAIVVTAVPSRVSSVKGMISKVDKKTPQILLEAKIIEVTLDKNDQFGIDWNTIITAAGAARPTTFPFSSSGVLKWLPGTQREFYPEITRGQADTNFPQTFMSDDDGIDVTAAAVANSIFSYGTLDFSSFQATLRLIDERDDTNILSSPRITTLNNQAAVIKVVHNVFLQKSQSTSDTGTLVTVEFEEEPREIGVILEVTPHVNDKREITVDLKPQVSSNLAFTELEVSNHQNTVAMTYDSREADTQVMVMDGETIFIGGLITETTIEEDHRIPIIGDLLGWIPILGRAVKYKQDNVDKTEVVFFITVHIIDSGSHSIDVSRTTKEYNKHYPKEEKTKKTRSAQKQKIQASAKKGKIKEENVVVPIATTSAAQKKKYKPIIDFRKK